MKNIYTGLLLPKIKTPIKTNRAMKLTCALLFAASFGVFATGNAQTMRVNIQVDNVSTEKVLSEIEKQTDYLFVYNKKEVDLKRKTSVNAVNKTTAEVISTIFEGTDIIYAIEGENIMLMRKEQNLAVVPDAVQQGNIVTGKIVDKDGNPVIGANVLVRGTSNGTISDMEGRFSLNVPQNAVLQVSYIGYLTQEVQVKDQNKLNILLREDTQSLEEVVVVGYGTQKKGEVASAISSIKSEKFIKTPSADPAQMIKGQVPGLTITTPDANPTSTSEISLRGITTLKASTSPLVLIDGIPGDLNSVSPDDIQQIDVLKDGSAAAIYGTRGTNGVILITTKNALGEMPTEVDVNAYVSTQQIVKRLPFMNAEEMRQRVEEGIPGAQDDGANTDWLDEVTRTPFTQIYNISLRGGSKTTNYVASFEYRGLNGLIQRTNNQMYYP